MAEYINYGDQQIDLLALLTAMADNVLSYVNSQTWSNKRKEKFLNAYLNMVNGGIKGASIENGTWGINIGNNIDLSTMGKKDREMYQEAAYFIQNLMRNLLPKAEEEKKPEEEKEKEVFDFNKHFGQALLNSFGGSKETLEKNWESLDSAQDNGLFSRTGRAAKIKQALLSLKDSIKKEDYNFEKSSYGSHKNFTDKLNAAINALDNPDTAKEALLSLGVNYKGLLDDYGTQEITLDNGTKITRANYAALKAKQLEDEQLKVAKQEALVKQGNRGVLSKVEGIHSVEARTKPEAYQLWLSTTAYGTGQLGFNKMNDRIQQLLDYASEGKLTGADKKELGNLLYYVRTNNPHYLYKTPDGKTGYYGDGKLTNVLDNEWNDLRLHTNELGSVTKQNFIRLPWQITSGPSKGRYVYADNQGTLYFLKPNNHLKFDLIINRSVGSAYNNYKNNFLKSSSRLLDLLLLKNMNTPIAQLDGLTPELSRELGAIALDFGAMVNPGAVTGTAMALSAAGLREQNRLSGFSWEKVFDWGTAALGGLPVLGDILSGSKTLYKLGNLVKTSAEAAGYMTTILGTAVGAVLAKNIVTKLANDPTSLNTLDLLNIAYGLMGIVGGAKTVRAIKSGKAYNQANSTIENTISVKTSSGKTVKIKVDDNEAKQIASVYKFAKNNTEANLKVIEIVKNKTSENLEGAKIQNGAGSIRGSEIGRKLTSTPNPILKRYIPNEGSNYPVSWTSMVNPLRAKILNRRVVPQENEKGFFKRVNEFLFGNYEPNLSPKITNTSNSTTSSLQPKPSILSNTTTSQKQLPLLNNVNLDRLRIAKYRADFNKGKAADTSEGLIFNIDENTGSLKLKGDDNITYFKLDNGKYRAVWTINGNQYSKNFNSVKELKERMAKLANELVLNHASKTELTETANMLRNMAAFKLIKANKQGGTIDKLRILKYKEYIKK